jgi:hypothetical protein
MAIRSVARHAIDDEVGPVARRFRIEEVGAEHRDTPADHDGPRMNRVIDHPIARELDHHDREAEECERRAGDEPPEGRRVAGWSVLFCHLILIIAQPADVQPRVCGRRRTIVCYSLCACREAVRSG